MYVLTLVILTAVDERAQLLVLGGGRRLMLFHSLGILPHVRGGPLHVAVGDVAGGLQS